MENMRLGLLSYKVGELEARMDSLSNLSNYMVQAHVLLREHYTKLEEDHRRLRERLHAGGILSHGGCSEPSPRARERPSTLTSLLSEPEVACAILMHMGGPIVSTLSTTCSRCRDTMEELAAFLAEHKQLPSPRGGSMSSAPSSPGSSSERISAELWRRAARAPPRRAAAAGDPRGRSRGRGGRGRGRAAAPARGPAPAPAAGRGAGAPGAGAAGAAPPGAGRLAALGPALACALDAAGLGRLRAASRSCREAARGARAGAAPPEAARPRGRRCPGGQAGPCASAAPGCVAPQWSLRAVHFFGALLACRQVMHTLKRLLDRGALQGLAQTSVGACRYALGAALAPGARRAALGASGGPGPRGRTGPRPLGARGSPPPRAQGGSGAGAPPGSAAGSRRACAGEGPSGGSASAAARPAVAGAASGDARPRGRCATDGFTRLLRKTRRTEKTHCTSDSESALSVCATADQERLSEDFSILDSDVASTGRQEFERGQEVSLHGLQTSPQLNGRVGTLVHYAIFSDRWHVRLRDGGQLVRARARNLSPCVPDVHAGSAVCCSSRSEAPQEPCVHGRGRASPVFRLIASFLGPASVRVSAAASPALSGAYGSSRLYICGGCDGRVSLDTAECFDICTWEWLPMPPMLHARDAGVAAVVGKRLYLCGGNNGSSILNSAECFDPALQSWRCLPPMGWPRHRASAAVLEGRIFICGGEVSPKRTVTNSVECFDPARECWCLQPSMFCARSCAGVVSLSRVLYVCGGNNGVDVQLDSLEGFDNSVGDWELLPSMSLARLFVALTCSAGRVYACGGLAANHAASSVVEYFSPALGSWQMLPPMLHARFGSVAAVTTAGRLLVCGGGILGSDAAGTVEAFDPVAQRWEIMASLQAAHCVFPISALASGCLYLMGGGSNSGVSRTAECLDLSSEEWECLPGLPSDRLAACVGVITS